MESLYLREWDAFIRYFETPTVGEHNGPTIVYLPAISFSVSASFFNVVTHPDMLPHRAILVDYLGSGVSDHPVNFDYSIENHARCVAAVLDQAGCRKVTVLGHSMGGTVALQLALTRPDLVGNLIIGEGNVTSGGGALVSQIAAHSEDDFVRQEYPKMQADLFEKAKNGEMIGLRRSTVWKHISPVGLYRNAQALAAVEDTFLDHFLALPIPRSFIYGEKTLPKTADEVGPDTPLPADLQAKGVATEIVPNAGHGQMFDNPDGFVKILSKIAF
jgi:pimeloyl-ACP methyl ester carboxylesterase